MTDRAFLICKDGIHELYSGTMNGEDMWVSDEFENSTMVMAIAELSPDAEKGYVRWARLIGREADDAEVRL